MGENKHGARGETYAMGVQVNLADGTPVNMEGQVVGDEWTHFPPAGQTSQALSYIFTTGSCAVPAGVERLDKVRQKGIIVARTCTGELRGT